MSWVNQNACTCQVSTPQTSLGQKSCALDPSGSSPLYLITWASQVVLVVKNPPANAGDIRDAGSIPGLRRSPRRGNGNPLQYSCLKNPMDRGAWWVTAPGIAKSRTRLSNRHTKDHFSYHPSMLGKACNIDHTILSLLSKTPWPKPR